MHYNIENKKMSEIQNFVNSNGNNIIMIPLIGENNDNKNPKQPKLSKWQNSTHTQFHQFGSSYNSAGIICCKNKEIITKYCDEILM
jgi:hypothetical protein